MGFTGESQTPWNRGSHMPRPPPGCISRCSPSSFMYPSTPRWMGWAISAVPFEAAGGRDELGLPPQPPPPGSPSSFSTGRVGGGGVHDAGPGPPRIQCPGSSAAPLSNATRTSSSKSSGGETVAKSPPGRLSPSDVWYSASVTSCHGLNKPEWIGPNSATTTICVGEGGAGEQEKRVPGAVSEAS